MESEEIEFDHVEENIVLTQPPKKPTESPPPTTKKKTTKDQEIDELNEDLAKAHDKEENVPINSLNRNMHYKTSARKSTRTN